MSFKQKMREEKSEKEFRREMERAIRQFCWKMNLKAEKRFDTIQFIADVLREKDGLARTLARSSSAAGLTELDLYEVVAEYLAQFSQEMDELVAKFTALSREAKDELEMLCKRG
jgi:hypothetical protein